MDPVSIVQAAAVATGLLKGLFPTKFYDKLFDYEIEIVNGTFTRGSWEGLARHLMAQPLDKLEEKCQEMKRNPLWKVFESKTYRFEVSILEEVIKAKKEEKKQQVAWQAELEKEPFWEKSWFPPAVMLGVLAGGLGVIYAVKKRIEKKGI